MALCAFFALLVLVLATQIARSPIFLGIAKNGRGRKTPVRNQIFLVFVLRSNL